MKEQQQLKQNLEALNNRDGNFFRRQNESVEGL